MKMAWGIQWDAPWLDSWFESVWAGLCQVLLFFVVVVVCFILSAC